MACQAKEAGLVLYGKCLKSVITRFPADDLKADISAFHIELREILNHSHIDFQHILEYILATQGKFIRPLLVLSFARLFAPTEDKIYKLAAAVEYIHNASLVHDDIIDESEVRRGSQTVHRVWDEKKAVLIGDFLYSRAFELIGVLDIPELVHIFASVANRLSAGELKQLAMNGGNGLAAGEDWCYEVIQEKTAVFFGACCESGTLISGVIEHRKAAQDFGCALGMIFQMRDDLLDYGRVANDGGKNLLQDLSKGKVTLPLLYAYQEGTQKEKELIHQTIESPHNDGLQEIRQIVDNSHAIIRMREKARDYANEAFADLRKMPAGNLRDSLFFLVKQVVGDI